MRYCLPLLIAMLAASCLVAQLAAQEKKNGSAEKKDGSLEPIKVIQLSRKEPVSFEKDIGPILVKKCQCCHARKPREGKLDLRTYESLMKGGDSGPCVVPGKANDSLLVKTAGWTTNPAMPPDEDPLTPEELALLKLWIDQGAKGPTTATAQKK